MTQDIPVQTPFTPKDAGKRAGKELRNEGKGKMLSDAEIRRAKPADKPYKLADTGNLHLYIPPTGARVWRMRYRHQGKENILTIGPYPAVTLAQAREHRDAAKASLRKGIDPAVVKKQRVIENQTNTFESLTREWHTLQKKMWTKVHAADVLGSLERDIFPDLGRMPVNEITPPMVLDALRKIEARPAIETAKRVRQRMSAVFVFAIASGRGVNDPAAIVEGALAPLIKGKQPAVRTLEEAREVLKRCEEIPAHPVTRLAMRFLAITVVRPGELRGAAYSEIDGALWTIPAPRMKMKREHLVSLPTQALEILQVLRDLTTGHLLFPSARHAHRPMSENALGYLLNRAGYHHKHVPHGWRATFSTVMNELYPLESKIIDAMLAHAPKDKIEGAYNRALYIERRKELGQEWADMLLAGRPGPVELIGLPQR